MDPLLVWHDHDLAITATRRWLTIRERANGAIRLRLTTQRQLADFAQKLELLLNTPQAERGTHTLELEYAQQPVILSWLRTNLLKVNTPPACHPLFHSSATDLAVWLAHSTGQASTVTRLDDSDGISVVPATGGDIELIIAGTRHTLSRPSASEFASALSTGARVSHTSAPFKWQGRTRAGISICLDCTDPKEWAGLYFDNDDDNELGLSPTTQALLAEQLDSILKGTP